MDHDHAEQKDNKNQKPLSHSTNQHECARSSLVALHTTSQGNRPLQKVAYLSNGWEVRLCGTIL